MTTFETAAQIEAFLVEQGLENLSTGGGFSGWFLRNIGGNAGWQIFITGPQDTAELEPGKSVYIALESPDGAAHEWADLDGPDALPEAIERLRKVVSSRVLPEEGNS